MEENDALILAKSMILDSQPADDATPVSAEPKKTELLKPLDPVEYEQPDIIMASAEEDDSPFSVLDKILKELDCLYKSGNVKAQKYFIHRVMNVCGLIQYVCMEDEDLALGSMLMEHGARYTVVHPLRTAIVCFIVSRYLSWEPDDQLSLVKAAITMNVGMMALQERLLDQAEPLSVQQKAEVRNHPLVGKELLEAIGVTDELWLNTVLQHHETLNGSGYPFGLKDKEVCSGARILSLADAYCARVAGRNYRPPLLPHVAVKRIFQSKSDAIDEDLAMIFVKNLGAFPPGTFVKLNNGETAIVTRRGRKINNPIVRTLLKADNTLIMSLPRRDTGLKEFSVKDVVTQKRAGVEINKFRLWDCGAFKSHKPRLTASDDPQATLLAKIMDLENLSSVRRTERMKTDIPAIMLDMANQSTSNCTILNLSEAGCMLKIPFQGGRTMTAKKIYYLTFRILERTLENVTVRARNFRVQEGCQMMGMHFIDLKTDQQKHISLYLDSEAEKETAKGADSKKTA